MKRRCSLSFLSCNDTDKATNSQLINLPAFHKKKLRNLKLSMMPPAMKDIGDCETVDEDILNWLNNVVSGRSAKNEMNSHEMVTRCSKFLVFLSPIGKDFCNEIIKNLSSIQSEVIFISHSFTESERASMTRSHHFFSSNSDCSKLSRHFRILDPLGGGVYPLDYFLVIDERGYLRTKLPIRMWVDDCHHRRISQHQIFGITIGDVEGLLYEYDNYFSMARHNSLKSQISKFLK